MDDNMDIGDDIDDEEMDNDLDEEYTEDDESQYDDEEEDEEFAEDGDDYVGGPNLGAGVYNQNILDGIQANSYSEHPRRHKSRKSRKSKNRAKTGEDQNTNMGDEYYDDDYDNEGKPVQHLILITILLVEV